jgi:maltose O-acetyltransferase
LTLMSFWRKVRLGIVNTVGASHIIPEGIRYRLLRWYGVSLGDGVIVRSGFFIDNVDLSVGDHSYVGGGCYFDGLESIRIGANCDIGMQVMFCCSTHESGTDQRRAGKPSAAPIIVEDGCWIGTRATLLPGVTVAAGCVVAAGAVVTRDTERNGLYGGVPATRIRDLDAVTESAHSHAAGQP